MQILNLLDKMAKMRYFSTTAHQNKIEVFAVRNFYGVLAVLGLLAPAIAQITITQGDFPPFGSTFTDHKAESTAVSVGPDGPGQTWTITDRTWEEYVERWLDPATTPYASNFPAANFCNNMTGGDSGYVYLRVAANGVFFQGAVSFEEGAEMIIVPDEEALFFPLPLTYLASWTSVWHVTIEPQPGFEISVTDSALKTVDGWGTLVTPFGSWPVLRVSTHEFMIRQMTFPPISDTTEVYSYLWLSADVPIGAEVASDVANPNPDSVQVTITITSAGTPADPPRGPVARGYYLEQNYPNPFNPETQINFDLLASGDVSLKVYNLLGEEVATLVKGFRNAGHNRIAFNAAELPSGTYLYRLQTNGYTGAKRMTLIK